jgi:hypothetical protein
VVETVQMGPAGELHLWSPCTFAAAQLAAFGDAEQMARTGIVIRAAGERFGVANLKSLYRPNGAPS